MMIFKKIHDLIPAYSLLKLFIGLSVIIQIAVISFSHFTGYYQVENFYHLLSKMFIGTVLTLLAMILIAYPDLIVIQKLNQSYPWNQRTFGRLLIQGFSAIATGVIVSFCITLFSHLINPYKEPLNEVLMNNTVMFVVCNLLIISILEGWTFFIERNKMKEQSISLQKEVAQIRFELLKTQINPHFMFNSLNVLSGLIETDPNKAQTFIDEFSHIYRYVLDSIDQPVTTVQNELYFARSYMYLQQIRYGDNLHYYVDLSANILKKYLPPLSLQVVLENAIKHNQVNQNQPLNITITAKDEYLKVSNKIQPKSNPIQTTGIGQKNLIKRYLMIGNIKPEFRINTHDYEVLLPLIEVEANEDTNNRG